MSLIGAAILTCMQLVVVSWVFVTSRNTRTLRELQTRVENCNDAIAFLHASLRNANQNIHAIAEMSNAQMNIVVAFGRIIGINARIEVIRQFESGAAGSVQEVVSGVEVPLELV